MVGNPIVIQAVGGSFARTALIRPRVCVLLILIMIPRRLFHALHHLITKPPSLKPVQAWFCLPTVPFGGATRPLYQRQFR